MSRKPYHKSTHKSFKVKAKNLRKGDRILFGGIALVVKSNIEDSTGRRGLFLKSHCGNHRKFMVIMPKNVRLTVMEHKFKSYPENR